MKPQHKKFIRFLKFLLGIGFIALIMRQISWQALRATFQNVQWMWVGIAGIGMYGTILIGIYRWKYLLRSLANIPYRLLYKLFFIGLFFGTFLPTNFGGDGVRALYLQKYTRLSFTQSLAVIFMERFTGLVSILLLLTIGIALNWRMLGIVHAQSYAVTLLVSFILVIGIFFIPRVQVFVKKLCVGRTPYLFKKMHAFLSTIKLYTRYTPLLLGATALALCVNGASLYITFAGFSALHVAPSLTSLCLIVPLAYLSSIIPLTPNGLGVTEGVFVVLFGWFGVAAATALGVALIFRVLRLCCNGLGGIYFLTLPTPAGLTLQDMTT